MKESSLSRRTEVGHVVMNPTGVIIKPPDKSSLHRFITPSPSHFVIAHMGIAHVDASDWQIRVGGLVDDPLTISYREIVDAPSVKTVSFLECAGNPLRPDKPVYRVGNAEWSGISLSNILRRAGVKPEGRYVWLKGVDFGQFGGVWSSAYVKDIPLSKALEDTTIIACRMNGDPLTPEHGFPIRAVVPGFYGTNSVKWLSEITVADERPGSHFTNELYNYPAAPGSRDERRPVWDTKVNSMITRPARGAIVHLERNEIEGWAWSAVPVVGVEISVDNGLTWSEAKTENRRVDYSWQHFSAGWRPTAPGSYTLCSRARDAEGCIQPETVHINQIYRRVVSVSE